jgi:hypothetical protein
MPIGDAVRELTENPLPEGAKLILVRHKGVVQPAYVDASYMASDEELHAAGYSPDVHFSFKKEPIFPLSEDERAALLAAGAQEVNRIYSF